MEYRHKSDYFNFKKVPPFLIKPSKTLIRLVCSFLPSSTLRKKVRHNLFTYCLGTYNLDTRLAKLLVQQAKFTLNNKRYIETLILGSSHGMYGYISSNNPHELNLSMASLDFYYMKHLYRNLIYSATPLKNLVIVFSAFNSGFAIQRSSEALGVAAAFYKQFYKINRNLEGYNIKQETDVETETTLFIKRFFNKFDDDYMRCLYELSLIQDKETQIKRITQGEDDFIQQELQRTIKHIKYAQSNFSMPHFAEILRLAKENHHKVFLIIPPHTKAYTKSVGHC